MSEYKKYPSAKEDAQPIELTISNKTYKGELYDSIWFGDTVPEGKRDYYVRHAENDFGRPSSIKSNKGITVNFLGTFVTSTPIDFGKNDELTVGDYNYL